MTAQPPPDDEAPGPRQGPAPVLLTINDAVQVLRLSRSVIYEQIKSGRIRVVHQGRATRIPATAIDEYLALLDSESCQPGPPDQDHL
jgi:excisionase family DNA binding protein